MLTLLWRVDKFGSHTFVSGAAHFVSQARRHSVVPMKSRFIITLLCVGAVAFACGPRAHSDANSATTSANTTTLASVRTVSQQGAARTANAKSPISAALDVQREPAAIRFALEVVNSGKKSIELTFPSGQTHDFVILDSLGAEVWRWGTGRLFTQALQNKQLSRGESLAMTEKWDAPSLTPGRYTVIATLKSDNYPVSERAEFSVGGGTLATRD